MDVPSTHTPKLQRSAITIDALTVGESVQVTLGDARSEAMQLFGELSEPQQHRLAAEAWQLGLRALGNAQAVGATRETPTGVGPLTTSSSPLGARLGVWGGARSVTPWCVSRGADVDLFVIAGSSAWSGVPEFARYGNTVMVQWDPEDPTSDAVLKAAVFSATFMATRRSTNADQGDIEALQDVDGRIQAELMRVIKMRKEVDKIVKASETLHDELRIGDKKLAKLLEKAKATMTALDVELHENEVEVKNPIALRRTSFADPIAD